MQIRQGYEYELDIKEAFYHVLYHWRSILAFALIGALLLGGYAFLKNRNIPENTEVEENQIQKSLRVDNAMYQSLLQSSLDYSKHSVLMNLDTDQEWQALAVYAVIPDSEGNKETSTASLNNQAVTIAAAYPSAIWYGWDEEKLSSIYGEDGTKYASELFSAEALVGSSTFSIKAIGLTKEMAEKGLQYLETAIQAFHDHKSQSMGTHRLEKVNEYSIQGVDTKAEKRKTLVAKNILTYQGAITGNQKAIEDNQSGQTKKSLVKYSIFGFAIGGCVLAFLQVVFFVLSRKLQSKESLQEQLGIDVFGEFNHSRACHPGKGFDRIIECWEFRNSKADKDTIIGNISALLNEKADSDVLLTGTLSQAMLQPLCDELQKKAKPGLTIRTEPNGLNNNQVVEAANRSEAVVLVEEKYVSCNKDIRRMAEILSMCDTPVIGAVIL